MNLAPLELGTPFNEAKSAIKWLEAALVATPTVASPTRPFAEAVTDGVDGFLARDEATWERHLRALLDDPALRSRVGERARRTALLQWAPALQGERYLEILAAVRSSPVRPFTAYEALDEPLRPTVLSQYALDLGGSSWSRRRALVAHYGRVTAYAVRERGLAATAADARRFLARRLGRLRS